MKSCFNIVPYFLKVSSRGAKGGMTPLKLQKLLYYSQAWYVVFRNKPLFQDKIEAWVHGPVVPSVYRRFKHFRYTEITNKSLESENRVNEEERLILNLVWNMYGNQEAKFLEHLTHSEHPWINARRGLSGDQLSSRTISLIDMKRYYSQFVSSLYPPEIHAKALNLASYSSYSEKLQNIFSGIGSVLDIFPNYQDNQDYYSIDDFTDELSDCESLESDWEKIGSDFLSIMDSTKILRRQEMTTFFDNDNSEKLQKCDNSRKRHDQKSKGNDNSRLTKQNQNSLETDDHLDAKYSDRYNEAEDEDSSAFLMSHQFSGPIPPPSILNSYEKSFPGSADRLITMAEKEQDHRHKMEDKLVDAKVDNIKRFYDERKRGQIYGLTIGLVGIISGSIIAFNGKQLAGSFIGTAGIGGIVSVFVIGRGKPKQDDNQVKLPPE